MKNSLFHGGNAFDLGIARVLFYAWYAVQINVYDPVECARLPHEAWQPTLLLKYVPPPSPALMTYLVLGLWASCVLACVGLFTRYATAAVAIIGCYVFGSVNSWTPTFFQLSPMIIISVILAFSYCGHRCSLDALLRRNEKQIPSEEFAWPIRLSQITFCILMTTAGFQKLLGTWLQTPIQNMSWWIEWKYYLHAQVKGIQLSETLLVLKDSDFLMLVTSVGMIVGETGALLILLNRPKWLRFLLLASLFVMQGVLAIFFSTLSSFPWLGAYLFFVPWSTLLKKPELSPNVALAGN